MALPANALTTVATAQGEISGLTAAGSTVAERLIMVATDAIERYCGRSFHLLSRVERYAPPRGERLVLNQTPVAASPAPTATLDGAAITVELEDSALGFLRCIGGFSGATYEESYGVSQASLPGSAERVLLVTYTAGWVTPTQNGTGNPALVRDLPYDLEQACLDTVASLFRRRGVDAAAAAYVGQEGPRGWGGIIPGPTLPTLNRYRRSF